jgi:type VI secretion system protein ImpE
MMLETRDGAGVLFREGKLAPAIEAANVTVRKTPTDLGGRILLAELLVFAGNLERADTILDAAAQVDPTAMVVVAEFRQLLRAETARRQFRREGRVPEFLGEPTPALRSGLAAAIAWHAGDNDEAVRRAGEMENLRPRVPGHAVDVPFDDFRDIDDLCAGFFEALTTTGKYYWIPTERVASIEFHPPHRPRDLLWRRATVSVTNGPDGDVYLPAIYGSDQTDLADELRLGRATNWLGEDRGPIRGVGQRSFLVGDDACSIMDLTTLRFGT